MKYLIDLDGNKHVRCWSCERVMELNAKQENDGDCVICGVEIDLTESPYKEESFDSQNLSTKETP